MVFFHPFTRSDVQPLFDWNTAHAKRSFTKQCKISFGRKKMIGNRFILITNRAFYSSSPFSKCSFVLLQITEWKQKYCETRNDWRTLPISHLSVWKITFETKSIFDRSHERCNLTPAMILTPWKSLSFSMGFRNRREREGEPLGSHADPYSPIVLLFLHTLSLFLPPK